MPELPEVQTTVNGLSRAVVGLRITDVWSDYDSRHHKGADNIKNRRYFAQFRKNVIGSKIVSAKRRAKNVLMNLDNDRTILVHMKMTGHLLYGEYDFVVPSGTRHRRSSGQGRVPAPWIPIFPESLKDPFNRHIHFMLTFDNGKRLALSDSRKFAKVTLLRSKDIYRSIHLRNIGPEPLDKRFSFDDFVRRLLIRPKGKVKQVLMDQSVIAGIGNIYADESLWRAGIHPLERIAYVPYEKMCLLFGAIKQTLMRSIGLGGDSMSDYRNIFGERGNFQEHHHAYGRTGMKCGKAGCGGTIRRMVIGGRSAHFCDKHQVLAAR